ncbi:LPXTG cell wall anchor domain-containing protein [Dactylosporangium sp. NPDC005572]|uniref:LPXTG cell wall anchor domain-containing protein n=1 Tax=Dactylosporangium sp. NPDC005572 TaxID=3156889 RepID=UPI0033BC0247
MRLTRAAAAMSMVAVLATVGACGEDEEPVPYTDTRSTGVIALYGRDGNIVTQGKVSDKPFVAKAVSHVRAAAPYDGEGRKATLLAFLPRHGIDPTQWNGRFLTGASTYGDPARPTAIAPAEADSLAAFLEAYPTQWNGLVQLRIFLGVPGEPTLTSSYASADIKVTGDTWKVVRGATTEAIGEQPREIVQPVGVRETGVPISVEVSGSPHPSPSPSNGGPLPRTGTDVMTIAGAGLALVAVGALAVALGRRRRKVSS